MGVVAVHSVIQLEKGLAVARGPTHVWESQSYTELVEIVVVPAQESRAELPFRSTVNVNDHRPLAGKFLRVGAIEEAGDSFAVKGLPLDELRLREIRRV